MDLLVDPEMKTMQPSIRDITMDACRRIPPLWSLRNFVAVNPFVGLTDRHYLDAAKLMQRVGHGEMLMSAEYYLEQIEAGRIQEEDLKAAIQRTSTSLPTEWAVGADFGQLDALQKALRKKLPNEFGRIITFAELCDEQRATTWAPFVVDEISKWCSAYYDQGQSSWRMPWREHPLFTAWKLAARLDANPELMGLASFREMVGSLPQDPHEFIERALIRLGVPEGMRSDFLHRALMSLHGWSSYVQQRVRDASQRGGKDESLVHLLAIRLVFDLALFQANASDSKLMMAWRQSILSWSANTDRGSEVLTARYLAQQALEHAYQNSLIRRWKEAPHVSRFKGRKTLQAVFCIDVRSEVFRRALESQSPEIGTTGFAGFFGIALEHLPFGQPEGNAQCPVLLSPKFRVRESLRSNQEEASLLRKLQLRQMVSGGWNAFKTSAISCFSFVETAGLCFAVRLIRESFSPAKSQGKGTFVERHPERILKIEQEVCCSHVHGHNELTGLGLADQIGVAAGALKNMGLVSGFAKVVLICGHGSATTNNPYGSAMDCGACGGHAGDVNARVMASLLNQTAVRDGLKAQGIRIPEDTVFIAGLHNTTTDDVVLYAEGGGGSSQEIPELELIREWISRASRQARRERAPRLGLSDVQDSELDQCILQRSQDWSQVRPEWGLAGNAAFIAAPRERTQRLNLEGRVFLHDYNAQLDREKSTLELILTAPVIVASWINLQYFGSTVDNRLFGSGNKVLHNVVGTFGVWQGNGGDLQPGLPLQCLHDGVRWVHEPLRLSVWIEALRTDVDVVLRSHKDLRALVDNGWIHLFVVEPESSKIWRRGVQENWEQVS